MQLAVDCCLDRLPRRQPEESSSVGERNLTQDLAHFKLWIDDAPRTFAANPSAVSGSGPDASPLLPSGSLSKGNRAALSAKQRRIFCRIAVTGDMYEVGVPKTEVAML